MNYPDITNIPAHIVDMTIDQNFRLSRKFDLPTLNLENLSVKPLFLDNFLQDFLCLKISELENEGLDVLQTAQLIEFNWPQSQPDYDKDLADFKSFCESIEGLCRELQSKMLEDAHLVMKHGGECFELTESGWRELEID